MGLTHVRKVEIDHLDVDRPSVSSVNHILQSSFFELLTFMLKND
jgi:hypothetical protein